MKKYDFEPILSSEVMKKNRLKMIQEEKEKKENKITMIIAITGAIVIITLLAINNKNYEEPDLTKCENGTIEIVTSRRYDNQIEVFCK